MGEIQKSVSNIITTTTATAVAGKKMSDDAKEKELKIQEEESKKQEQQKALASQKRQKSIANKREIEDVALESDLINLGVAPESARAYALNKRAGVDEPNKHLISKEGKFVATYGEMAQIMADKSLVDAMTQQVKGRGALKLRRTILQSGKTHQERVKNAVAMLGGKY